MLENTNTILGIIASILTIIVASIGFYGVFKKDISINVSGIEYSFKSFKQQNRNRNINSIGLPFKVILWSVMYIILYYNLYYMARQFDIEAEMAVSFLINLGSFHFAVITVLYNILMLMSQTKKYEGKKKVFFYVLFT